MARSGKTTEKRMELDAKFSNTAWRQAWAKLTLDDGQVVEGREILLPLSPSDDRRLQPTKQGRLCNSYEYNGWLARAIVCLKINQLVPYAKDIPLYVYTLVVMPNNRADHHNFQKALYDAMEKSGHVLTNDRQIIERHTRGMVIKDYAFTLSYIFPAGVQIPAIEADNLQLDKILKRIDDGVVETVS